jgi:RNA polymerase sigma-70 factor (ECF subfamily)
MSSDPVDDELLALHQRLLDGDRAVSSELVPLLLSRLQQRLAYLRASVDDPNELTSQIGLAVTHYLNDPERFDPSRGGLVAYLAMVVRGDVLNELDARRRRRTHEVPAGRLVELDPPDRNTIVEEEALDAVDPIDVAPETAAAALQALSDVGEVDLKMLKMMVSGVRATSAYAAVLGISHLPDDLQRKAVKRHKDRLQKRLERLHDRLT